jgi:hypothetical protein
MFRIGKRPVRSRLPLLAVALIATIALALGAASGASAHSGGWYWSAAHAEAYVNAHWTASDTSDFVDIQCDGTGMRWKGLYHHFRCDALDDLDRTWSFTVHPVTRYRAVLTNFTCDDTDSEYTCDD